MSNLERKSGILLHITSLPTKYGVGTLGKEAFEFVDWMKETGMSIWQVLPLVPTNYGDSPYQSVCSTALNYYMLDFEILTKKGLLVNEDYENEYFGNDELRCEFSALFENKTKVLKKAFKRFDSKSPEFKIFLDQHNFDDFALFMTIKEMNDSRAWNEWDAKYQAYSKELEDEISKKHTDEYLFWQWTQYEFINEWNELKSYAHKNGIEIMGDMPLYVAYDSVEVWKHPELFMLDENKNLVYGAGCPPDAFSDDGQLWGNPVYDWPYHKNTGYEWWNVRLAKALELYDFVRIDHFRGFDRFYAIPAGSENARIGNWLDGPKFDLFKDKKELKIVVEDLGIIDDGVRTLVAQTGYPGMKILEFAFDGHNDNEHKPANAPVNSVIYTGTHDNMPLRAYIEDLKESELNTYINDLKEQCKIFNISPKTETNEGLVDTVVELAYACKSNLCIIPMQDLLAQGRETRMNLPSTVSTDNWSYRIKKEYLSSSLSDRIKGYNQKYNR